MKPLSAFLLLLFTCIFCNAQSPKDKFITYGLQKDRAATASAHGEFVQAMAIYDSAFALIRFMGNDYFDAALNALKAGSDQRANDLLIKGTENGLVVKGMYDSTMQAFLMSERSMPYLNMRDYMNARWLAHADTVLIRKLKAVGGYYIVKEESDGTKVLGTDSSVFDRLFDLVKENGYPTPLRVGMAFYHPQRLLLKQLENDPDSPELKQVLDYIRTAINRGGLPPDHLAPFQDMIDVTEGKPMTYGALLTFNRKEISNWYLVDRATLNANRASVGLGPIEDFAFRTGLDLSKARFAER
ncbi:MAG: hypothetical protein IPN44_03430 [Flavobacteriales bacterium]|nr:hypothetical protein [Flavobacteriales bacterium]